jgi:hypothetical protein
LNRVLTRDFSDLVMKTDPLGHRIGGGGDNTRQTEQTNHTRLQYDTGQDEYTDFQVRGM